MKPTRGSLIITDHDEFISKDTLPSIILTQNYYSAYPYFLMLHNNNDALKLRRSIDMYVNVRRESRTCGIPVPSVFLRAGLVEFLFLLFF